MSAFETSWISLAGTKPICLLPVGSVEQHGPHLPLTVDAEIAQRLSAELRRRVEGVFEYPTIYYSCSREHAKFPGTVWVSYTSLYNYARDILRSMLSTCDRVIVVCAHGGACSVLEDVAREINYEEEDIRVVVFNLWKVVEGDHAGEVETSTYLALGGRLVGERPVGEGGGDPRELNPLPTNRISPSGVVGRIERVEVRRGEELVKRALEVLSDLIKRLTSRR